MPLYVVERTTTSIQEVYADTELDAKTQAQDSEYWEIVHVSTIAEEVDNFEEE